MRKSYISLMLSLMFLFVFSASLLAQPSEGGTPPTFKAKLGVADPDIRILPSVTQAKIDYYDQQTEKNGTMLVSGESIPVNLGMQDAGSWTVLDDGSRVWRLTLKSKDAQAISIVYDEFYIPRGGKLFIYNELKTQILGAFTYKNNPEYDLFATELVQGDVVTLEYVEPKFKTNEKARIHIQEIAHVFRNADVVAKYDPAKQTGWGSSQSCEVNINCSPVGDSWQDQKRGVAEIWLRDGGNWGWCSGTLVNNTAEDGTPYFLTADHCGGSSASDADLLVWEFYFNYESPDCTTPATEPSYNTVTGCVRRAVGPISGGSDFFLVELNSTPPASFQPYYNGWDRTDATSSSGAGIHHPAGDIKKISTYSSALGKSGNNNVGGSIMAPNTTWIVQWASNANGWGVTEGGSSGSPLFDANGRQIGTLSGGSSYCTDQTATDIYGRFYYHWDQNGTTDAEMLQPWLDPSNTGVTTLNGFDPYSAAPPSTDFSVVDPSTYLYPIPILEGENVDYQDESWGSPTAWSWVFDGGTPATSSNQNPTNIVYSNAGLYDVSLTATNTKGDSTVTASGLIRVIDPATTYCDTMAQFCCNPAIYTSAEGYVGGSNEYGIEAVAEGFAYSGPYNKLTGGRFFWAQATAGAATDVVFNVWGNDGSGNPSSVIATKTIPFATIVNDFTTNGYTDVTFDADVILPTGSFFLGFEIPGDRAAGDTLAILTNDDNDSEANTGYSMYGGAWETYAAWGMSMQNAIFAHTCYDPSIPPVADFSADQTMVWEGGTINFTDESYGSTPTSWTWSFPGGTPNSFSGQNPPTITYNTAGIYNVSLTVSNANGTDTETKTAYITVNDPTVSVCDTIRWPWAWSQTAYLYNGYASGNNADGFLAVSDYFQTTDFSPYQQISGARILFGEVQNAGGTTNVEVKVWDGSTGSPGTELGSVTVAMADILNDFNAGNFTEVSFASPISVSSSYFVGIVLPQANGDSLAVATTAIDENLPNTGWIQESTNAWTSYADYFGVSLTHVITPIMCTDPAALPVADFVGSPLTIGPGETVDFSNLSIGATSYSWQFTGGTPATSTDVNPTVTYPSMGVYTVKLTANNSAGSDVETKTAYVNVTVCQTVQMDLTTDQYGGETSWDLVNDADPGTILYSGSGYDATTNYVESWCLEEGCYTWTIYDAYNDGICCAYGNGEYSIDNLTDPQNYGTGGTFTSSEAVSFCITLPPQPPVASFYSDKEETCQGTSVQFTDASAGVPTSWSWTFDGGTPGTSTAENPLVTYNTPGTYDVSLTVNNAQGTDSKTITGYITVTTPATLTMGGTNETSAGACDATASATPVGGVAPFNYVWDATEVGSESFTGGTGTLNENSINNFTATVSGLGNLDGTNYGIASVCLDITQDRLQDLTISLIAPDNTTVILVNPASGSNYTGTCFDMSAGASITTGSAPFTGTWIPEGNLNNINNNQDPNGTWTLEIDEGSNAGGAGSVNSWSITFNTQIGQATQTATDLCNGTYNVTVTDQAGCESTGQITLPLSVAPVADFSGAPTSVCEGSTVTFTDLSTNAPTSWAWSFTGGTPGTSNAQNPTITYNTPGTYAVSLTVNNANGSDTKTVTNYITVNANPTVTMSGLNPNCNGGADGTATATPAGSVSYTYAWSNSGNTQTITGLTSGTYDVTVTDENSCVVTGSQTLTDPAALSATITGTTDVTCNGAADGTATADGIGGVGGFSFNWSNGDAVATATGLSGGTYTVTVTDNNGCEATTTATINEPAQLVVSTTQTNVSCNGGTNGSATASATGGTSPYGYAWSNGNLTATASGLAAGTYTVTATDANGCTDVTTVTITEPSVLAISIASQNNVDCFGGSDGTATATATGGTSPYGFAWSTGALTATASGLSATTYTVTVTDNLGCQANTSVTITEPAALTASIVGTDASCNGYTDGAANLTVTGGTPAFNYSWSNTAASEDLTGLGAGTYSVTVTDNNTCQTTASVTITEPAGMTLTVSSTDVSCNGGNDGEATVNVTGGTPSYSYTWVSGGNTATESGLSAGTYNVTVEDGNTCQATASATISQPDLLTATTSVVNVSCNGGNDGNATVAPTGGTAPYSYTWSSGGNAITESNLSAGTYTVTIEDANSCSIVKTVTITEPSVLNLTISSQNDVSCFGNSDGSATASATGGTSPYGYSWSSGAVTATATGLAATTYTVTVTDNKGCQANTSVTINEPAQLTASIVATDATCNGTATGSANLTVSGGTTAYSYNWSNTAASEDLTNIAAGTYSVTVTDAEGCIANASTTVNEPTAVLASIASTTDVSCNGGSNGSATASATGGTPSYSFTWSNGGNSATETGLSAGTYTVTAEDANGCIGTTTATITEPTLLTATTTKTNITCNGLSDGTATATPSGGTSPYYYNWSSGGSGATETGLAVGSHTVTISDDNGCSVVKTVNITEPTAIAITTSSQTNVGCNGESTGSATISATGGTPTYTYAWETGSTTATQNSMDAGTWTVSVTDANGCEETSTVTITEPALLAVSVSITDATCNGDCDGEAIATVTGGTASYTYQWDDPSFQTTATASGLCVGNYNIDIQDANGCTTTASASISEPAAMTLNMTSVDASCGNPDGSATVTASNGTTPYSYVWTSGGTDATETGLAAGSYDVTVSDANGCEAIGTASVNDAGAPSASISSQTNVTCNGACNGSATVLATGGSTPYTYTWSTGGTTDIESGLCAGNATVTVTDNAGCNASATAAITEPTVLNASITGTTNVSCNGGNDGTATVSVSGGTGTYTYAWPSGGNAATETNLAAGTYEVTISDASGCEDLATATITEPALLEATITVVDVLCNGEANGSASASITGGTTPYSYNWQTGGSAPSESGLAAGTYDVTITDSKGCEVIETFTINEPTLLDATVATTDVSVAGGSDGDATVTATGGTGSYAYAWDNGGSTATITGLSAGTYEVTVSDANGCEAIASGTVNAPGTLVASIASSTNATCYGLCNGDAALSVTGGVTPYTYAWDNGDTDATISGLCAGTYNVTVSDANSVTATTSITITEPVELTATTSSVDVSCNGDSDGSATVTPNGGTLPYSYLWDNGTTTATTGSLAAATYLVTVTDDNSCNITTSATVGEPAVLTASITGTDPLCFGTATGTADLTVSGGTSPFLYDWSSTQASEDITDVAAGTYDVTVTDDNACQTTATVTLTDPTELTAIINTTDVSTAGGSDGEATAVPTGGTPSYAYAWDNGGTDATISGLTSGSYEVTITDANGCNVIEAASIYEPGALIVSIDATTNVTCFGACDGTATISVMGGTSPYSYNWDNGETTESLTDLCAGTYNLTVTDNGGATSTVSVTITEPTELTATTSSVSVSCFGLADGSVTVSPNGGVLPYAYTWLSGATTQTQTGLITGDYTVTVTDNNGCQVSVTETVLEPAELTASIVGTDVLCNGGSTGAADLTVSGGTSPYIYDWSTTQGSEDITDLIIGDYTVTVTDDNNCSTTATVTISEPTELTVAMSGTDLSGAGNADGEATATPAGGVSPYTYLWSNAATDATISGLDAGTYDATVTDDNGCEAMGSITITEPDALTIATTYVMNVSCEGNCDGEAAIEITGGIEPYAIAWDNSEINDTITGLCAGTYNVTVTDDNGNTASTTVDITEPAILATSLTGTDVLCNGAATGEVDLTVSGGTSPYLYLWSNGASTEDITGVVAGDYTVTVTDINGCVTQGSHTLIEPTAITLTYSVLDENTGNDGQISITVAGGVTPYTFAWSNGSTDEDQVDITAGVYTVTVTDDNGCELIENIAVNNVACDLSVGIAASDISCNGLADGEAMAFPSGGTTPYTYTWSTGATDDQITNLAAGTYTVSVEDANACIEIVNVTIIEPEVLTLTIDSVNATSATATDGSATVNTIGGTTPYTYLWSNAATTQTISDLAIGTYDVTVTDANGCFVTGSVEISFVDEISIVEAGASVSIYPNPNKGQFTVAVRDLKEDLTVTVMDMQGRVMDTRSVNSENTEFTEEFDLNNTPKGVYIIRLTGNSFTYVERIIVK